jgi:ABC-type transporter Mla subunit MlaD
MSNQYSGRHPNDRQRSDAQNPGGQARKQRSDAVSQVSDAAQSATSTAKKKAASEAASTITDQVKELLDSQLASGVEMVGHLGSSAQRAADDLNRNAPQLAGLVRGVADRIEGYADDMRDQSVDELFRSASNFTRRQPALVFGLAALAGFFAFRTIKSTPLPTQPVGRSSVPSGDYYGG